MFSTTRTFAGTESSSKSTNSRTSLPARDAGRRALVRRPSGTKRRLAAREMDLQHAELGGFGEDPSPGCGIQLLAASLQGHRIGTVRALQGAAVRQFRQHPHWRLHGVRLRRCHATSSTRFSTSPANMAVTSWAMRSRGA